MYCVVHSDDADEDGDGGEGGDGHGHGDNDLGGGSSAGPFLPVGHAVRRPCGWPWRSGGFHEKEAAIIGV